MRELWPAHLLRCCQCTTARQRGRQCTRLLTPGVDGESLCPYDTAAAVYGDTAQCCRYNRPRAPCCFRFPRLEFLPPLAHEYGLALQSGVGLRDNGFFVFVFC